MSGCVCSYTDRIRTTLKAHWMTKIGFDWLIIPNISVVHGKISDFQHALLGRCDIASSLILFNVSSLLLVGNYIGKRVQFHVTHTSTQMMATRLMTIE